MNYLQKKLEEKVAEYHLEYVANQELKKQLDYWDGIWLALQKYPNYWLTTSYADNPLQYEADRLAHANKATLLEKLWKESNDVLDKLTGEFKALQEKLAQSNRQKYEFFNNPLEYIRPEQKPGIQSNLF